MPFTAKQVVDRAKPGDTVTTFNGTGRVVFARPDGEKRLVLNMGGKNGTPGIATAVNITHYKNVPVMDESATNIDKFIAEAQVPIAYEEERKAYFHREGKRILKMIVNKMGLADKEYSIRSNMGGIAVSGEVTLHADFIYVQFSQTILGQFMFRECKGQKDYTGGMNRWMRWDELRDLDLVANQFNLFRPSPVNA